MQQQQIIFDERHIIILIQAILVIVFIVSELIISKIFIKSVFENIKDNGFKDQTHVHKYFRAVSAESIMRFVSITLKTALALTFALGIAKIFADLTPLLLPDSTLGYSIFISYCGLVSVYKLLADDLVNAFKKIF